MRPAGRQLLVEFSGCPESVLTSEERLSRLLTHAILASDLGLVGVHSNEYEPHGVTVLAIISESHVVIHTYPESGHLSLDIFYLLN